MDNIIVINGHVSRLETRLSDSPWEDAGSRGSCYDQPGMPVPPVLNICSYPAVAPEAPSEAAPDAAPELDIRPYPAMAPEAPAADTASEATMEATPGPRSADPALDMLPSPAITPETVLEAPSSSPDANGESEENDRNSKGQSSRHYRTAKRARAITRIAKVPDIMAVPSLGEYKDAMTILTSTDPLTMKKRPAWLNLVLPEMVTHLTYKNDELLYDGVQMPNIDLVNYLDMTPARVSQTDTVLLRALYATMLLEIEEDLSGLSPEEILETVNSKWFLNDTITIYVPDLVQALGGDRGSWHSARVIVDKIKEFLTLYGSIEAPLGNKMYYIYRPALTINEDDQRSNTIDIGGPHLRKLIAMIKQASMETDKKGHVKTKRDGTPFMLPSHSYMIKSTLATERNKRAAEIVCAIVPRIEQAGSHTLTISAKSILEVCPGLRCAFEEAGTSSNKTRILRNAFLPAWKLMRTQTRLEEFYKNLRLPGDDKEEEEKEEEKKKEPTYPTAKNLNVTFTFRHDGKKKQDADGTQ